MKNTLLHLQYKHSGTLANRKHEELSDPPNQKICDPIIVNPCKCDPIKRHIPISPLKGSAPPPRVTSVCYFWEGLKPETLEE